MVYCAATGSQYQVYMKLCLAGSGTWSLLCCRAHCAYVCQRPGQAMAEAAAKKAEAEAKAKVVAEVGTISRKTSDSTDKYSG